MTADAKRTVLRDLGWSEDLIGRFIDCTEDGASAMDPGVDTTAQLVVDNSDAEIELAEIRLESGTHLAMNS